MTKGILIPFCCLLLMISFVASGQSSDPSIPSDPSIYQILDENLGLKNELDMNDINRITLRQMGQENRATVMQLTGQEGPNLVHINQEGLQNHTLLLQTGQGNATDIDQVGQRNRYLGIHAGEDIINTVIQNGNENVVRQFLVGHDMDFYVEQNGDGFELNQIQAGEGIGYKVIQTGKDMNITIIQDYVLRR